MECAVCMEALPGAAVASGCPDHPVCASCYDEALKIGRAHV